MTFIRLTFLFFLLNHLHPTETKKLTLGLLYIATDRVVSQVPPAVLIAQQDVIAAKLLPKDVEIVLDIRSVVSDSAANDAILEMINNRAIGSIGPAYSYQSVVAGITAGGYGFPITPYASTTKVLSNNAIYGSLLRLPPRDDYQADAILKLMLLYEINDAAVVSSTETYSLSLSEYLLNSGRAAGLNIPQVGFLSVGFSKNDAVSTLIRIRESGIRFILIIGLLDQIQKMVQYASEEDLTGYPYIYAGGGAFTTNSGAYNRDGNLNETLKKAFDGAVSVIHRLYDPSSLNLFNHLSDEMKKQYDISLVEFNTPYAYDSYLAYVYAISKLKPSDYIHLSGDNYTVKWPSLLAQLISLNFKGITGEVSFDENFDRKTKFLSVFNHDFPNDTIELSEVGTYDGQTGNLSLFREIFWTGGKSGIPDSTPHKPIRYYHCDDGDTGTDTRGLIEFDDIKDDPNVIKESNLCNGIIDCTNWSDEDFDCSSSLWSAMIAIGIIVFVIAIIILSSWLFILIFFTKFGRLRASGWIFLMSMSFGSLLGVCSVYLLFGKPSDAKCLALHWIPLLASGIIIGSLCAKQWRIWKIFTQSTSQIVAIRDYHVLLFVLATLIPDVAVMIIWSAVDRPRAINDEDEDSLECSSDYKWVFYSIIIAEKILLLGLTAIFATVTRNVPAAYSEAKILGVAVYNSILIVAVFIPIIFTTEPFAQWIFAAVFIIVFFVQAWTLIILPKLYGIVVFDLSKSTSERKNLPSIRVNPSSSSNS